MGSRRREKRGEGLGKLMWAIGEKYDQWVKIQVQLESGTWSEKQRSKIFRLMGGDGRVSGRMIGIIRLEDM